MLVLVRPVTQVPLKQKVTPACNGTSPGMKRDHPLFEKDYSLFEMGVTPYWYRDSTLALSPVQALTGRQIQGGTHWGELPDISQGFGNYAQVNF